MKYGFIHYKLILIKETPEKAKSFDKTNIVIHLREPVLKASDKNSHDSSSYYNFMETERHNINLV